MNQVGGTFIKTEISLLDVIKPECIRIKVKAKTPEEAIRIAGMVMLEQGIIEERYVEAMVNVFKKMGPYIVIAPRVCLPHAGPDDGAKKVGIAILTLENAICFGNKENDPVKICIAFATPDKKQHVKVLASIAELLQNKQDVEDIANAKTPEDIIEVLIKYK
jgi:mannitol/fructose-specific phosphotransferase system IIA component (Ntr-type)